ncbi:hypothetical protein FF100_03515 [Methylobacterium terricola]|uniref:Uncharacterized protein n=1 Tax=Methylobacterium terricola TaxID=2583531 RepID=A0A5C4LQ63_9HYPH|nr:hypothetical protein [Methylobacterium terricola]TNC16330.1 hypothetical protein FF100_03515 [Methylobacterium terricola]
MQADQLQLNVKAQAGEAVPEAAPVNLGGGFIEFLITGRINGVPRRDPSPVQAAAAQAVPLQTVPAQAAPPQDAATADAPAGDVTIVDYSGPIEPGSVILNVTKREVYRILPNGRMAIYRNDETQIRLARAILKQTGR